MVTAITRPAPRKRPAGGQSGQSVVEFALVSLTLIMLTFGIIDFGRAVFARSMLTNAIREAARYGSVGDDRRSATAVPAPIPDNSTCDATTFCGGMVAAAQRTSPSLGLNATHFTTVVTISGTPTTVRTIGCTAWGTSTTAPSGFWNNDAVNGDGSLTACRVNVATGKGDGTNRLTVCATYPFQLTAPRLLRLSTITMRECARSTLQ